MTAVDLTIPTVFRNRGCFSVELLCSYAQRHREPKNLHEDQQHRAEQRDRWHHHGRVVERLERSNISLNNTLNSKRSINTRSPIEMH